MHKQIGQQRGDNTSLRCPFIPAYDHPIFFLHWCSKPALNVQQDPPAVRVTSNRFHQKSMIDIVEKPQDIKLQNPVMPPATLAGDRYGLMSRFARSITVRIIMEMWFNLRFEHELTTACAIRSETVGIPKVLSPPDFFGIATAFTGGGK